MKTVKLNELAPGLRLTQAFQIDGHSALAVPAVSRPVNFATTLAASMAVDITIPLRMGDFNIEHHMAIFSAYSRDNAIDYSELVTGFFKYVRQYYLNHDAFMPFITMAVGSSNKPIRITHVSPQAPTAIAEQLKKNYSATHALYEGVMTDWVSHAFGSMNWLVPERALIIEISRTSQFPSFTDLVDTYESCALRRFLEQLQRADLSIVQDQLRLASSKPENDQSLATPQAVSPTLVATQMAYAIVAANDSLRGRRASQDVVGAVLSLLGSRWDPELPVKAERSKIVNEISKLTDLSSNFAYFLAYQEMVKGSITAAKFSDEELRTEIIPDFVEAMATCSPFAVRPISDVIGHLGSEVATDHQGRPLLAVLHENWNLDTSMTAFDTVRFNKSGTYRFIMPYPHISTRMSDSLGEIMKMMSLNAIVKRRVDTFDAMNYQKREGIESASVAFAMPSLVDRLTQLLVPANVINDISNLVNHESFDERIDELVQAHNSSLQDGVRHEETDKVIVKVNSALTDVYKTIMHYSVAFAGGVSIGRAAKLGNENRSKAISASTKWSPALQVSFNFTTQIRTPIGKTAIIRNSVTTPEAIEAIAYIGKRDAAMALARKNVDFEKYEDNLHTWDWYNNSETIHLNQTYIADLAGEQIEVTAHASDLFGTGSLPGSLRYMKPSLSAAITSMWFDVYDDTQSFLDDLKKANASDLSTVNAVMARNRAHALGLVMQLRRIGYTIIGQNASSFVMNSVSNYLYGKGKLDAVTDLHKGIEHARFETWCGLAVISQLGLLSVPQSSKLTQFIKENEAIVQSVNIEQALNS